MTREEIPLPDSLKVPVRSRGRTITEGDFSAMTNLTWTIEDIHTDVVMMQEKWGHERMLAGGCVVAFALGLASPAVVNLVESHGLKFIALVGYDNIRFESPLFPGDTIYVEAQMRAITRTSKPHRGVGHWDDVLVDHTGRRIMRYTRSALCDLSNFA